MDAHLVEVIQSDSAIAEFFEDREPDEWFFGPGAVGIGPGIADPVAPWMAWKELPSSPFPAVQETSNAQVRNFQIFVYDEKGDYTRINAILREVRRIVKAMAPFTTSEGHRCSQSEWLGFSGSLPADEYSLVCRYGTARFAVSQ